METNDFYCDYVLNNKIEIRKVAETQDVLAFFHTKPSYKTHIVVIPKQHIAKLKDLTDYAIIGKIFAVIGQIINDMNLDTFKIVSNSGNYQDSKHLHFHIIAD